MKITIIFPQFENKTYVKLRPHPPLALPLLASLIPEEHEIKVIDECVDRIKFDDPVDLIFISSFTSNVTRGYEIADKYRSLGVSVIMGGIHVSFLPDEALEHADAVCIGEGENLVKEIINDFKNNALKKKYKCDHRTDLSKLPFPQRKYIKMRHYPVPNTVQATRGCPFGCEYCTVTHFYGRSYRFRPVSEVIAELRSILETARGLDRFVFFVDDNLLVKRTYAHELLKEFKKIKNFGWTCMMNISVAKDEEMLKLIKDTNCVNIFLGLESISQDMLKKVGKKHNTVAEYEYLIGKLHDYDIPLNCAFMFGFDDDDPGVFERTYEFAQRNAIDVGTFSILTPYPGTTIYKKFEEQGRLLTKDWRKYDSSHVVFEPRGMSAKELRDGLHWLWREYYTDKSIQERLELSPSTMKPSIHGPIIIFKGIVVKDIERIMEEEKQLQGTQ
jgi:radical SAM superfamily enzyme YgiQ (UPF0313 family)